MTLKKLEEKLKDLKTRYYKKREVYEKYETETKDEVIQYIYQMKINQIVGYIDCLDDILESIETAETEDSKCISINTDVISGTDLLLYVESEYKLGKITEKEYIKKRGHILSRL